MVSGFMFAVVLQNTKNAKSLAVECDGPTSFTDSIDEKYKMFLENDGERLAILQSAGWTFYRIKYSDWMEGKLDWSSIFRDIVALLD
jgi:hypothetical protein